MVELALIAALTGLGVFLFRKPSASPTSSSGQRVVTLDEAITDADRDAVIHAVLYTTADPPMLAALDALGSQMTAKGLPCASYELAYRGWELRGASGPPPQRPAACATTAAGGPAGLNVPGVPPEVAAQACALLDPSLDMATCSAVLTALTAETDPGKLDGFAAALAPTHPKAAGALAAKAQILRGQPQPALPQPALPQPAPAPTPAPPAPPAPAAGVCPGLDANLTATQCGEVVNALAPTTIDPAYVQSVAATYASYPLASVALAMKLTMMGVSGGAPSAPSAQAGALYSRAVVRDSQPMEPAIAAAAALTADYQGSTEHVEGAAHVASLAVAQAAAAVDVAMPEPIGTRTDAQAASSGRPAGYWHIQMRTQDTPWPQTIAKIGSGGKSSEALSELFNLNPHLHSFTGSGVVASFKPGDEVNVPGAWKDNLIRKGFKLVRSA